MRARGSRTVAPTEASRIRTCASLWVEPASCPAEAVSDHKNLHPSMQFILLYPDVLLISIGCRSCTAQVAPGDETSECTTGTAALHYRNGAPQAMISWLNYRNEYTIVMGTNLQLQGGSCEHPGTTVEREAPGIPLSLWRQRLPSVSLETEREWLLPGEWLNPESGCTLPITEPSCVVGAWVALLLGLPELSLIHISEPTRPY